MLTQPNKELGKLQKQTPPGMAFWAGTGPDGMTCGSCKHFMQPGYAANPHKERRCAKYIEMMKASNQRALFNIPKNTPACKYFEARPAK